MLQCNHKNQRARKRSRFSFIKKLIRHLLVGKKRKKVYMKKQKNINTNNATAQADYADIIQEYTSADKTIRTVKITGVPQTLDALRRFASDDAILQACIKQAVFHTLLSKVRKQGLEEIEFALSIPRAVDSIKAIERAIVAAVTAGDIAKATELSMKLTELRAKKVERAD